MPDSQPLSQQQWGDYFVFTGKVLNSVNYILCLNFAKTEHDSKQWNRMTKLLSVLILLQSKYFY